MSNIPTYLVIHHTASSRISNPNQFNATNNYHKERGFTQSRLGFYVGYHWEINAKGEAVRAREDDEVGCHCKEQSMNYKSIGIALDGNFDIEDPTNEQKAMLLQLIRSYQVKFNIPNDHVVPHRYFATAEEKNDTQWKTFTGKKPYKSCWGSRLPDDIIKYLNPPKPMNELTPSDWAKDQWQWLLDNGIVSATTNPRDINPMTPERIGVFLKNYHDKFNNSK